jgi:predicted Zn-dependent protease
MTRAGYDPASAVAFWQRFAAYAQKNGGDNTPKWLRTHPLDSERIENLRRLIPQAKAEAQRR